MSEIKDGMIYLDLNNLNGYIDRRTIRLQRVINISENCTKHNDCIDFYNSLVNIKEKYPVLWHFNEWNVAFPILEQHILERSGG